MINLQSLERVDSTSLDECREYIVGCMESVRRLLAQAYREEKKGDDVVPLQMTIAFSLEKSGMANLELELLPFLLDLLKNHFPGMVGAVFVLHYSWVHAGMWGLAKRVLPQQALDKIVFPSKDGLIEFFDEEHLPRPFGGSLDVEIDDTSNDVMAKYARPVLSAKKIKATGRAEAEEGTGDRVGAERGAHESSSDESWERNSAPPSPRGRSGISSPALSFRKTLSRSGSFDSLVDEFHSVENTVSCGKTEDVKRLSLFDVRCPDFLLSIVQPWGSRRGTPKHSMPSTPRLEHAQHFGEGLPRMTPKAAQKLKALQMTRGEASLALPETRSRTKSTPTPVSSVAAMHGDSMAPDTSSSRPISRHESPMQSRRGTLLLPPSPLLPQQRLSRNVHFHENEDRRGGSLRDFRLGNQTTPGEGLSLEGANSSGGEGDESDSVESGKDGQKTDELGDDTNIAKADDAGERSFFSRWRRGSRNVDAETKPSSLQEQAYRKELMRQQQEQAKSPPLAPESAAAGAASLSNELPSGSIETLPSPQLQVADLEEPPISGIIALGPSFFSRRTRKFAAMPDHVSPYNASNPFYGYPAYPSSSATTPKEALAATYRLSQAQAGNSMPAPRGRGAFDLSTLSTNGQYYPRHMHVRRRKRDLIRTLAYLFVLRLLGLHRSVRARLLAMATQLGRALAAGGEEEGMGPSDGEGAKEERWKMAEERYRRLKRAGRGSGREQGLVGGDDDHSYNEGDDEERDEHVLASRRRMAAASAPQGRPLATLGIQKRYAILFVLLVLLSRQRWRRGALQGLDRLRLWIVAGAGSAFNGRGGLNGGKTSSSEEVEAGVAAPSEDVWDASATTTTVTDSSYSSITGLHLRQRLGIK